MRYPTMTRVFAVFLALCSLMLIGAGIFGMYTSDKNKTQELRQLKEIEDTAEQLKDLSLALQGGRAYKEEKEELSEKTQDFQKAASEHRRELTEYTAKKGGMKIGTEALDQADAAVIQAKAELSKQRAAFEAKEAEFNAGYEEFSAGKEKLRQGRLLFDDIMGLFNAAEEALNATDVLEELRDSDEPKERLELAIKACNDTVSAMDRGDAAFNSLLEGKIISEAQAQEIGKAIEAATGTSYKSLREKLEQSRDELLATDPETGMSLEDYIKFRLEYDRYRAAIRILVSASRAGMDKARPGLNEKNQELTAAEAELYKAEAMLEEGRLGLEAGRRMLNEAEAQLQKGAKELYEKRTLIWYELGQLEDKFQELKIQKAKLQGDSEALKQLEAEAKQRKELEGKYSSASLKLRDVKEIREEYEKGGDLYEISTAYANKLSDEISHRHSLESLMEGLMILNGILGFLPLFFLFGKERSRKIRLFAPVLVLILSSSLLIFGCFADFGLLKSLLTVLLAALALLISAIPNKKKKVI